MQLPLLSVSGDEVVLALHRAGFRTQTRSAETVVLGRALRRVAVPLRTAVDGDALVSLLRAAGISYATFLELLDASFDPAASARQGRGRALGATRVLRKP